MNEHDKTETHSYKQKKLVVTSAETEGRSSARRCPGGTSCCLLPGPPPAWARGAWEPYLQGLGGRLHLQVALAGGVPAAEGQVAGQVLGPHGLSAECRHLGLKKTGYSVKAWRLGVGRGGPGDALTCPALQQDPLMLPFSSGEAPPQFSENGVLCGELVVSHLHRKQVSKTGHRVLAAGSVRGGWPMWPLRGSSITY